MPFSYKYKENWHFLFCLIKKGKCCEKPRILVVLTISWIFKDTLLKTIVAAVLESLIFQGNISFFNIYKLLPKNYTEYSIEYSTKRKVYKKSTKIYLHFIWYHVKIIVTNEPMISFSTDTERSSYDLWICENFQETSITG